MSKYDWLLYTRAEAFLNEKVTWFQNKNHAAARMASIIEENTSTRFFDWVDHVKIPNEEIDVDDLVKLGFEGSNKENRGDFTPFRVKGSTLFPILLGSEKTKELAIAVECLEDFRGIHAQTKNIEGVKQAPLRKLEISRENSCAFSALERNGSLSFNLENADDIQEYVEALETLDSRNRHFESDEEGINETGKLVQKLASNLESQRLY